MLLRPATLDDLPLLKRWDVDPDVRAATGIDDDNDWDWEDSFALDGYDTFLAEVDGRPLGVVQILDPHRDATVYWGAMPPGFRALDLWIGAPEDRGRGLGAEMLRLAVERCFADPTVHTILLDPLESNDRACRFYEREGFRIVGPRRFGEDDCLVYRLDRPTQSGDVELP
ncbi:MAG: acetyltransferase [Bacteroidetes bacterium]|nr:acetyltransferase [Bacteroidota bacterium]